MIYKGMSATLDSIKAQYALISNSPFVEDKIKQRTRSYLDGLVREMEEIEGSLHSPSEKMNQRTNLINKHIGIVNAINTGRDPSSQGL